MELYRCLAYFHTNRHACAAPYPVRLRRRPTTAPAATFAAATPTAEPSPDFDPALYRPAMRPEFAADVNGFGNAPRYSITLTVNPDALQAAGRERVRYTNTDSVALNEIYFRLFPSAPGFGGAMTVTSVTVGGQTVPFQLEQRGTALKVPVTLAPGASADLTLDFLVGIPRDPTVGYAMFGSTDGVTALPDFYPVIPVRDETGWHIELAPDYGDETFNPTALYDVSITAPVTQVVVTSGTCQPPKAGVWHCVSGPDARFHVGDGHELPNGHAERRRCDRPLVLPSWRRNRRQARGTGRRRCAACVFAPLWAVPVCRTGRG